MKKKKPAVRERHALILALLGESPKTAAELVERGVGSSKDVGNDLHRLKLAGKAKAPEARGAPWRLDGPAVSPLREEDDPSPPPSLVKRLNIAEAVVFELRGGPLGRGDLLARLTPHLAGRDPANLDAALGRLRRNGTIGKDGALYRLGNGDKSEAEIRGHARPRSLKGRPAPSPADGKPQVIRDLYELRDRIDLSIELLEGRIEIADVRRPR